jgi:hypothetical protein
MKSFETGVALIWNSTPLFVVEPRFWIWLVYPVVGGIATESSRSSPVFLYVHRELQPVAE